MAEQDARVSEVEPVPGSLEVRAHPTLARDEESYPGIRRPQCHHGLHGEVETLLPFQSANGPNHEVIVGDAERAAHLRAQRRFPDEAPMVDPVRNDSDPVGRRTRPDKLAPDFVGDCDHSRKPREQPLVDGVVQALATRVAAEPAVRRGKRNRLPRQQPRQDVALVLVGVNDVDSPLVDDPAEGTQDRGSKRLPLTDLTVVDAQLTSATIDLEVWVVGGTQITHRHGKPRGIRLPRAEENRLFGSAAGASDGSKLQDPDRTPHSAPTILRALADAARCLAICDTQRPGFAVPPPVVTVSSSLTPRPVHVAALFAFGVAVRLLFFTGLGLGDDVFYVSASAALSTGDGWPPLPYHWHTRLGMTAPTALALSIFGWHPGVFVWLPFAASLVSPWLTYLILRSVADERTAWWGLVVQITFPLEVIYSTHLFPDLIVGTLTAGSLWAWVIGLRTGSSRAFIGSGLAVGVGYLCRESVVLHAPIYAALWLLLSRRWTWRVLWVAGLPLVCFALECALFWATTGDPMYRWHAIATQQTSAANVALVMTSTSGGSFWTDPLWMLATSQELGVLYLLALPLAAVSWRRHPQLRWAIVWLVVGLVWTLYGTTVPDQWLPLQRDPRYAAALTIPAVAIVAVHLTAWRPALRLGAAVAMIGLNLAGASFDQRGTILSPHRAFISSPYAERAVLEPFEYIGARWTAGLSQPVPFACATDAGRMSVVGGVDVLPGAQRTTRDERPYFVLSPERRPDLLSTLRAAGWRPIAELTGDGPRSRQWMARVLALIPSQRQRATRLARPPGLLVLQHPRLPRT